jgi:(p)ppGpp synthase/HD superfamily hydrolase
MWQVAQTNLQLYNQLRARGWSREDLRVAHRAYELTVSLYSGWFQHDGKPFVAHTLGVASILAHLGRPVEVVATGLLHNIYGNGDFGDGRIFSARPARRRLVRAAVGSAIEELVYDFHREMRLERRLQVYEETRAGALTPNQRDCLLIDLADVMEKHLDLGVLYAGAADEFIAEARKEQSMFVAAAERLGYPQLATELTDAFAATFAAEPSQYEGLQPSDGRHYLELIVPRSCFERPQVVLRRRLRRVRERLRRARARKKPGQEGASAPVSDAGAGVL